MAKVRATSHRSFAKAPGALLVACFALTACVPAKDAPLVPRDILPSKIDVNHIPLGLARAPQAPKDSPLTEARARLGRALFFDPILSADRTLACASCHDPAHGLANKEPIAVGVHGKKGRRNAPSLWNRGYAASLFWDGRSPSLEAQALKPIEDPHELGSSVDEAVKRLKAHADYSAGFQQAFGEGPSADTLAKALASFERTLLLGNSRVDRFRAGGDAGALTSQERHGLWLWESKARCWRCHNGPNFSDEQFHNTGVNWGRAPLDLGRFEITKNEADRGKFRTPSLRGVAHTAPYMHDGSLASLEDVVAYYNRGGTKNAHLDPLLEPLGLSQEEIRSLVAFLHALSEGAVPKK
jgi:cytochrome c peroxidase